MLLVRERDDEAIKAELTRFKGVGAKTVACVLMFCLERPEFPVDTHVRKRLWQVVCGRWIMLERREQASGRQHYCCCCRVKSIEDTVLNVQTAVAKFLSTLSARREGCAFQGSTLARRSGELQSRWAGSRRRPPGTRRTSTSTSAFLMT